MLLCACGDGGPEDQSKGAKKQLRGGSGRSSGRGRGHGRGVRTWRLGGSGALLCCACGEREKVSSDPFDPNQPLTKRVEPEREEEEEDDAAEGAERRAREGEGGGRCCIESGSQREIHQQGSLLQDQERAVAGVEATREACGRGARTWRLGGSGALLLSACGDGGPEN